MCESDHVQHTEVKLNELYDAPAKRSKWVTVAGYLCMVSVLACWVGGSEVVESLQSGTAKYKKPMIISSLNHIGSSLLVPLQSIVLLLMGRSPVPTLLVEANKWDLARATAAMAYIFLIGDYFWMLSLQYLTVAVASTVFNTSAVFVYIMCVFCGFEQVTVRKVGSVCVALVGVAVISFLAQGGNSDSSTDSNSTSPEEDNDPMLSTSVASVLCTLSAALYAAYDVYIKVKTIEWEHAPIIDQVIASNWLTTMVGLWTIPFAAIMLTITSQLPESWVFHEVPELPTSDQSPGLFTQAAAAFGFNTFFALTIMLLSPLIYSLGCMLTIPIAALIDYLFRNQTMKPVGIAGALLVIIGFLALDDNICEWFLAKYYRCRGFDELPQAHDPNTSGVLSQSTVNTQRSRRRSSLAAGRLA